MQQNPNSISINSNQSTPRNNQRLKQLKTQIILNQKDLQYLLSKSNKFQSKVIQFNHLAIQNLQNDQPDQALLYLLEAEKILQKAGQKSFEVQKKLIICTLHNLACCYQKNWQLQTCSNYLQALIYNLNLILKNIQTAPSSSINQLSSIKLGNTPGSPKALSPKAIQLMLSIQVKERLGRYFLQFCAVNSQIRNHSGALISARKSIQTMKKMFKQLTIFLRHYNTRKQGRQQFQQKLRLIHQVSKINDNINVSQYEMILQTTKYYLRKWQNSEQKQMVFSQISTDIEAKFRNFSIGSIAQISPVQYDQLFVTNQLRKNQLLKTDSIIQKVLVMIIGYFTISTQLRLLAESKNPISQVSQPNHSAINQDTLQQTRQAQIFHLFSIMLASIFIPFQILYMKHILLSYKNHYNVDLFDEKGRISQNNKIYDQFLFTISQIKKGSMLGIQWQQSLKGSQLHGQIAQIGIRNKSKDPFKKFNNLISNIEQKDHQVKSKSKNKRKTKSKSKSKNKKSTLKTISALSAHSKNKQKIQPTNSKSPQIHTQPSLSKSKHKKSSAKINQKITSLQYLAEQNLRKKQKSRDLAKTKHEYAGIKPNEVKKKKNNDTIEQTNAYFLKKNSNSNIKGQSKSKSKDSKLKKQKLKGLTPNNPTQLYFHKVKSTQKLSKSKSKQKPVKKSNQFQKLTNSTSPAPHGKRSLYAHYS